MVYVFSHMLLNFVRATCTSLKPPTCFCWNGGTINTFLTVRSEWQAHHSTLISKQIYILVFWVTKQCDIRNYFCSVSVGTIYGVVKDSQSNNHKISVFKFPEMKEVTNGSIEFCLLVLIMCFVDILFWYWRINHFLFSSLFSQWCVLDWSFSKKVHCMLLRFSVITNEIVGAPN